MPESSAQIPRAVQFQLTIIGPLLLGLVCGFFLGINAVAYWAVSIGGVLGGLAGGGDFAGPAPAAAPAPSAVGAPRRGAVRGLVAGLLFGTGALVPPAASGDPAHAPLPPFEPLFVPLSGGFGMALAYLGARLTARPT